MPYDVVQKNSGTMLVASGTNATLGAGATAGNVILISFGSNANQPVATGFTRADSVTNTSTICRVYYKVAAGGETSFAITQSSTQATAWECREVAGLDTASLIDSAPSAVGTTSGATTMDTFTTGTLPSTTTYDGYLHAVFVAVNGSASTVPAITAHTGGLTEDTGQSVTSGTTAVRLSVATKALSGPSTSDYQATVSIATTTQNSTQIAFACAGTRRAPQIEALFGGWIGTAAGLGTTTGQNPFDAVTGSPAVVNAGTDAYLELSASAAIENVQWFNTGALGLYSGTTTTLAVHARIEFPSGLPGADTELVLADAGNALVVRYVSASQQLGAKVGTGTEQLSAGTVAAATQYRLELRMVSSATAASIDWRIDGVDQVQATGTTSSTVSPLTFGWVAARTATVRYRDLVVSRVPGAYPLGDLRIYPLKADPAGTLTASTTADFQTFTANGTTAAWNAATALAAIDDIPPTIGASADGVVQAVSSATDFVTIPMETRNAAANGQSIRAVRWYFPGWAASTTAATIGFRGFDGTTETVLWAAADPNFDNSTTTPGWVCRMHRTLGASSGPREWTQTQLDALAARFGFGNAAVKIGVHAVLAEVAMRTDPVADPMFGDVGAPQVTALRDQDSGGIVQLTTTAADYQGAALHYEVNSAGTDVSVAPGGSRTDPVGADYAPSTNYVAMYPDPEGVADT